MGGAVGSGVWVVRLSNFLSAESRRGRRAARIGAGGGIVTGTVVCAAVRAIGGSAVAIVAAMPSGVSVVGSPVVHRGAAVPIAIPTAVSPAAATVAHHSSNGQPCPEGEHTCGHQVSGGIARNDIGVP